VLTTKAAPWRGLVDHGAGWWVETGTDALHAALTDLVAAPQERLAAMGVAGRAWIQRDLAWETVAHRMAAAYAWLGGGPQPDDVTA
ncbi:MAG: glycosyltransferase, partial [Planctomycetes bacterium]|nr:glycosyltransferase [Planctomycetota bacterium]